MLGLNEIPQPPFTKGGLEIGLLTGERLSSPFSKAARHERLDLSSSTGLAECGDRGGFCCAVFFPKTTAAYSLYKQS